MTKQKNALFASRTTTSSVFVAAAPQDVVFGSVICVSVSVFMSSVDVHCTTIFVGMFLNIDSKAPDIGDLVS